MDLGVQRKEVNKRDKAGEKEKMKVIRERSLVEIASSQNSYVPLTVKTDEILPLLNIPSIRLISISNNSHNNTRPHSPCPNALPPFVLIFLPRRNTEEPAARWVE